MKITTRLTGPKVMNNAPEKLASRLEDRLETASPPRLEGRFRDGRDRTTGPCPEEGDLRRRPRPEPRATRNRT